MRLNLLLVRLKMRHEEIPLLVQLARKLLPIIDLLAVQNWELPTCFRPLEQHPVRLVQVVLHQARQGGLSLFG